jgi:hypothetical protein
MAKTAFATVLWSYVALNLQSSRVVQMTICCLSTYHRRHFLVVQLPSYLNYSRRGTCRHEDVGFFRRGMHRYGLPVESSTKKGTGTDISRTYVSRPDFSAF